MNHSLSIAQLIESPLQKPKIHPLRLFCTACSYTSVQIAFGFAFALFSPLMQNLGVKSWINPVIWLLGPAFGLIQPFIGAVCDKSESRFGRRRPYIATGILLILVSYVVFVLIQEDVFKNNTFCIVLAIVAFCLINFAINVLMLPARAIVFDVAGEGQEALGNSFIALCVGIGNAISYIFSALIENPYYYGMGLVVLVSLPTLLFAPEQQYIRRPGEHIQNPFRSTFRTLRVMFKGGPVIRAALVFAMSWWAYFSFNTSATLFVAQGIYHWQVIVPTPPPTQSSNKIKQLVSQFISLSLIQNDDSEDQKKKDGIKYGSFAMMVMSFITSLFSLVSSPIQKKIGVRITYFVTQLLATLAFFTLFIVVFHDTKQLWIIFVIYSLLGFNFCMFNSAPFAIVSESINQHENGLYAGAMNIFCLVGQTLSQVMCAGINGIVKDDKLTHKRVQLQWDYLALSIVSLFATLSAFILKRGRRHGGPGELNVQEDTHAILQQSEMDGVAHDVEDERKALLAENLVWYQ